MITFLTATQVIFSILLVASILLQSRGEGIGSMGGTSSSEDTSTASGYSSRRGAELFLHKGTIILAGLFIINALIFPFFL